MSLSLSLSPSSLPSIVSRSSKPLTSITISSMEALVMRIMVMIRSSYRIAENKKKERRGRAIMKATLKMPELLSTVIGASQGSLVRFSRASWTWIDSTEVHIMSQVCRISPHSLERHVMWISIRRVEEVEIKFFYIDILGVFFWGGVFGCCFGVFEWFSIVFFPVF